MLALEWPQWFFLRVDDTLTGAALTVIAVVAAVWGLSAILTGYKVCTDRTYPRWHHRRWWPKCFSFRLGVFLLISDAGTYALLGAAILRNDSGLDIWASVFFTLAFFSAIWAFAGWANENVSVRRES